jgi:oligopeptidase A
MDNPLLDTLHLPIFSKIVPDAIEPALDHLLAENRATIKNLLETSTDTHFTWSNLIAPLEELSDRLESFWSPIGHLNAVLNSESLRKVYHACLTKLSDYQTELGQNESLYKAYLAVAQSPKFKSLNQAQQKLINDALRDFKLSGVTLPAPEKKRFAELEKKLTLATNKFEENVLDATDNWSLLITDEKMLEGLPENTREEAKSAAKRKDKEGWLITIEAPVYISVITYAENATLRQTVYEAYTTRASDQGPNAGKWDNSAVMLEILNLRHELAGLLHYKNYAELSLATKMAKSPEQVLAFLNDLANRSYDTAIREFEELEVFANENFDVERLNPWDIAYYSEKLYQFRFSISQEELRTYFPADHVLHGLFTIVKHLFGIHVLEKKGIDTWHPDVRFYEVYDANKQLRGQFYLDLYARPRKKNGAWMDECRSRHRFANGHLQIPVAYLTCNFSQPLSDKPSLLTHDEVITLFHEFGHGIHHMLTQIDYPSVSGISGVAWDAVEMPSQFLENWCWEKQGLDIISNHYVNNTPLPTNFLQKMIAAKNFQSAMHMVRQLEFSLFDFRLHHEFDPKKTNQIQKILDEVRKKVSVVPIASFNRFQNNFSHIFAGSYGAGYYSYKWAEVLASDAFAVFEESGILNPETGKRFLQSVLEQGGSREAMELFIEFRGREPTIDALLRHSGLQ